MDIQQILLIVGNVIFAVLAVFLYIRYKKLEKKIELKKDSKSELAGIADLTPEEFKPPRFGINQLEKPEAKTDTKAPDIGSTQKIDVQAEPKLAEDITSLATTVTQEPDNLKLEGEASGPESRIEIPEEKEATTEAVPLDSGPTTDMKDELKLEDELPEIEEQIKKETEEKINKRKKPAKKEPQVTEEKEPRKKRVRRKKAPVQEEKTE